MGEGKLDKLKWKKNQVEALTTGVNLLRQAHERVSLDKQVQGPQGESQGRGPRPFSLSQLLNFMKMTPGSKACAVSFTMLSKFNSMFGIHALEHAMHSDLIWSLIIFSGT